MALKERDATTGLIPLLATETVIGVVLNRQIGDGVKVRPTNVTATISPVSASTTITGRETSGGGALTFPANGAGGSTRPRFNVATTSAMITTANLSDGDTIRFGPRGLTFAPNNSFRIEATVTNLNATAGTFTALINGNPNTNSVDVAVTFSRVANGLDISVINQEEHEEFILLHNGPKGGFTQNFRAGAGDFRVNDVVQSLITDQ